MAVRRFYCNLAIEYAGFQSIKQLRKESIQARRNLGLMMADGGPSFTADKVLVASTGPSIGGSWPGFWDDPELHSCYF